MSNVQEWQQLANKELSRREKTVDSLVQQTAEGIAIKPLYTEADLDNLEVTGTLPGLPRSWPACHYVYRPTVDHPSVCWFLDSKESNAFIAVTWPPTEATTPITHAWRATSAKRASLSTPWKI